MQSRFIEKLKMWSCREMMLQRDKFDATHSQPKGLSARTDNAVCGFRYPSISHQQDLRTLRRSSSPAGVSGTRLCPG